MNPWDRREDEDDEAFLWWQAYRDALPPRRLERVRTAVPGKVAPTLQTLLGWYNAHAWRERAGLWDAHLDQIRQKERESIIGQGAKELAARDMALINEASELVSRELDKMLRTSMQSEAETLKPSELNKLLENVIKLGRLQRGETTEKVETSFEPSNLTDEEIKKLYELKAKLGIR